MSEFVSGPEMLSLRDEFVINQELKDALNNLTKGNQKLAELVLMPPSADESAQMFLSPTLSIATNPEIIADHVENDFAFSNSVDKKKMKHCHKILDKYVEETGGNLYPTKNEKQKLADEMEIPYAKVNRYFANSRRKHSTKNRGPPAKRRAVMSPATINATSAASADFERVLTASVASPESIALLGVSTPDQPINFNQAIPVQTSSIGSSLVSPSITLNPEQIDLPEYMKKMVVANTNQSPMEYLAQPNIEQLPLVDAIVFIQNWYKCATMEQPSTNALISYLSDRVQAGETLSQVIASIQQSIHQQQMNQLQSQSGLAPNSIGNHNSSNASDVAQWGGSSISGSPLVQSDSEVSDMSELSSTGSQYDYNQMMRTHLLQQYLPERSASPPFKDPHQLADPEMTLLLENPQLASFRKIGRYLTLENLNDHERLAIGALTDFANRRARSI